MTIASPRWNDDVIQLSAEIANYLAHREGAADTFEGLVTWWLFRQRLETIEAKVQSAVDYLVEQDLIAKRVLADGSILYIAKGVDQN